MGRRNYQHGAADKDDKEDDDDGSCKSRWQKLAEIREPHLRRARICAQYTIPTLIPPLGANANTILPTPWTSLPAEGVNKLTAKIVMAILPPGQLFFRQVPDNKALKKELGDNPVAKDVVETALADYEETIHKEQAETNARATLSEAFKHYLHGDVLLEVQDDTNLRFYPLSDYCLVRDPQGNLLELIIREWLSPVLANAHVRKILNSEEEEEMEEPASTKSNNDDGDSGKGIALFTHIQIDDDAKGYSLYQECKGKYIEGSDGYYPMGKLPYIPLRYNKVDGEDYGRGIVEEYLGDIRTLDGLSQAIAEGAMIASQCKFGLDPNSLVKANTISRADNGAIIAGLRKDDVHPIQANKAADLTVASNTAMAIEKRLRGVFMMDSAAVRDAERVTATEIQRIAGEIDSSLGGIFSLLAVEFQLPYARILIDRYTRKGLIPKLPKGFTKLVIITGSAALGRGQDLEKLSAFISGIAQELGPQVVSQWIDVSDYLMRRASALGLNPKGLVKTQDQVNQQMQQANMQTMATKAAPQAVAAAGKLKQQQMQQQHEVAQSATAQQPENQS